MTGREVAQVSALAGVVTALVMGGIWIGSIQNEVSNLRGEVRQVTEHGSPSVQPLADRLARLAVTLHEVQEARWRDAVAIGKLEAEACHK